MKDWFTTESERSMYDFIFSRCWRNGEKKGQAENVVELIQANQPWKRTLTCPCRDKLSHASVKR